MWIQRLARVSAGHAWRIAFVLAGLLAASLVYGELGGRIGAQIALAVFLLVLVLAWPRSRDNPVRRGLVPWGRRRRRIAALEADLARARSSLEEHARERERLEAALQRLEVGLRELEEESASQAAAAAGTIAEARAQAAALERLRAAEQERLSDELRDRTRAVADLERALEAEIAARRRAEEEAASAEERASELVSAVAPAVDPGPHLVFFPLGRGYRLVPREGPAPLPGVPVELPDAGSLVVSRLGRSPLPGDTRRCAYLGRPPGRGGGGSG